MMNFSFLKHKKTNEAGKTAPRKKGMTCLLEFRCRGKLITSFKTEGQTAVIRIGKASDNDWIIPPQDRVSADHHAELHPTSDGIRIQTCGKEKIHVHGKAVGSHNLKLNDRISIGDCELFVKPAAVHVERPCDVHRLEFQNGPRAGEIIRLEKKKIRIGSAADNDIVIEDDVVSHCQAEIRIEENGESWIKDLGSLNGTFVNGDRLERTERMLMDSDEISIAFFDLTFLDRNVPHTRSHAGKKIMIMILTIVVILGFFGLFYVSTPHVSEVIAAADFYTRKADFDAAERMVERMPSSRDFQKYEKMYSDYLELLAHYRKTFAVWTEFRNHLRDSEWRDAVECFGRLESENRLAWNWEDATVDDRLDLVRHAKRLLDLHFRFRAILSSGNAAPETLQSLVAELKDHPSLQPDAGKDGPDWLQPLYKDLRAQFQELESNSGIFRKMTQELRALNQEDVDFKRLIDTMNQFQSQAMGSVRVRAQDLIEVLENLHENRSALLKNQEAFFNMRFSDINRHIPFVSADECLIDPAISEKRKRLIERQEALLRESKNLIFHRDRLAAYSLTDGKIPPLVEEFASPAVLERAFSFPCLKGKMPDPHRKKPSGEYDRMFGIRFFYEIVLQSTLQSTNLFSEDFADRLELTPECVGLAKLYRTVEETSVWLALPENQWMRKGKILELASYCESLLKKRTAMLDALNAIAQKNPGTRKYFAAKAAYFYFAPASSVSAAEMRQYADAWKKYRLTLQECLDEYDPLKGETTRAMLSQVLDNGIPGDPLVNRIWSQMTP